jgi:hypothetical protein
MKKTTTKEFTCKNCKQVEMLTGGPYDLPEPGTHYLCAVCDDAYYRWMQKSPNNIWVEGAPGEPSFLKSNLARTARKESKSTAKKI